MYKYMYVCVYVYWDSLILRCWCSQAGVALSSPDVVLSQVSCAGTAARGAVFLPHTK